MKKLMHILTGWGRAMGFLPVSSAVLKLSQLRLKECGRCAYSKDSSVLEVINGKIQEENSLQCTKCGCPCLEKTLVIDEACPILKW